ncbi:MAG: autotransporter outer membrane beta-barrel domain-containing protein [Pseudomonadota bacterium]
MRTLSISFVSFIVALLIGEDRAFALSEGCTLANAGSLDFPLGDGNGTGDQHFAGGEFIKINVVGITDGQFGMNEINSAVTVFPFQDFLAGQFLTTTFSVTTPTLLNFDMFTDGGSLIVKFLCSEEAGEAAQQSSANAAASGSISQTAGLVAGRISSLSTGGNRGGASGGTGAPGGGVAPSGGDQNTQTSALTDAANQTAAISTQGLVDLSAGRKGMAAGAGDPRWGVWANFAWSGIQDRTAAAGQDGNVITGMAGADYLVSEGFIVGGGLSIGGAAFDSTVASFDTEEVSFGLSPYLAYQVTDTLSVDAIAGYIYGRGESTRAETITGHYGIHRYFMATNASYFQSWDSWSILGSAGIVWGQSFENAYGESDGTQVGSRRSDIGSVKALFQTAYLFEVDTGSTQALYLEPYVLGEYSYDFVISKIAGHNNDRDQFRLGLGMNIFSGLDLSGNLEASTTVGREDQRMISVLATVRRAF